MADLHAQSISPAPNCAEPTLSFQVRFSYRPEQEMFIGASARVRLANGLYLGGTAIGTSEGSNINAAIFAAIPRGSPPPRVFDAYLRFSFQLSPREVGLMHSSRTGNPPSDIQLLLEVQFQSAELGVSVLWASAQATNLGRGALPVLTVSESGPTTSGGYFLLTRSDDTLIAVKTHNLALSFTIHSSTWVRDYPGPFALGKFLVVELPGVEPPGSMGAGELNLRVSEAAAALRRMEQDIQNNQWTQCSQDARPVLELINRKDLIRPLLATSGLANDKVEALLTGLENIFTYTHAFHHRVDRAGVQVEPAVNAEQEDAYLAFAVAGALLNLVARKLAGGTVR
jgi:hypothetical protein